MARSRHEFHIFLKQRFNNVYYQPPPSTMMAYPAVVYTRDRDRQFHANNDKYLDTRSYQITVIDRNPDSEISEQVNRLPMCTFDRSYTSDNLNHFVYTIYF